MSNNVRSSIQNVNVGYNVNEIRSIYGYDKLPYIISSNGPEVNICIIIGYSYPNLQSDLDTFCKLNNIESTTLNIVKVNPNVPSSTSWALEICLDTQWVHAICPYAKITVVEAASDATNDMIDAIKLANSLKPQVINMSWGGGEFQGCESIDIFNDDILYVASTGDHNNVEWPSTNPGILAVSATTLLANSSSSGFVSESAWSSSGCGYSQYFPEPTYQSNNVLDISTNFRMTSDLSIVGNPDTGCYVYSQGQYEIIGGTSLSAPIISGTMAIIAYQRLLNNKTLYNSNPNSPNGIQNILYNIYGSDKNMYNYLFYDVTQGTSGNYSTMKGYDLPCGLGSPKIETFVPYLVGDTITPSYKVAVTAHSIIEYSNNDNSTGSASSVVTVTATSSDIKEKNNIEASLISHLEKNLVCDHLLNLVSKDNMATYAYSHEYKIECNRN